MMNLIVDNRPSVCLRREHKQAASDICAYSLCTIICVGVHLLSGQ